MANFHKAFRLFNTLPFTPQILFYKKERYIAQVSFLRTEFVVITLYKVKSLGKARSSHFWPILSGFLWINPSN